MDLIIDTLIFLWYISANKRLKKYKREILENPDNNIYLSVASVWECVIKHHIGKLNLPSVPS